LDLGLCKRGEDWEEKDKVRRRIKDYAREGRTGKRRIK
jgi:hypothetical protein